MSHLYTKNAEKTKNWTNRAVYFQNYQKVFKGWCLLKYLLFLTMFSQNLVKDFEKAINIDISKRQKNGKGVLAEEMFSVLN